MAELTTAQAKALGYIHKTIDGIGSAPTLRELCDFMGYKAIGSAQDVIASLRKKGFLESPSRQAARAFLLTQRAREWIGLKNVIDDFSDMLSIPCLGTVPAGNPLEAIEERVGTIRISSSMFNRPKPNPDHLFAVQTSGLSMVNAGILDGDWLIVQYQNQCDPSSVVIARVDGEVTCKRLMNDLKKGWYLKPENPDFQPIWAWSDPFEIVGRVLALQRSLS